MPRKEGQIIDRGISQRTGKQMYLVRVANGEHANGRRKYISQLVHGGLREAQRVQRDLLTKRDQGELQQKTHDTVGQYLSRWLETHKTSVKTRTYLNDLEMVNRYLTPHFGRMKLDKLTPLKIQGVYAKFQEQGLSASTIRRIHAVFRNALKWAVQWQVIPTNPTLKVQLPKVERTEIRPLTPEEAQTFLEECKYDRYGLLFQFLLLTGCRPGEAFALQWKDVDLTNKRVSIRRTYSQKSGQELYSSPKTKKGNRSIPILDDELLAGLKAAKTELIEKHLGKGVQFTDDSLVFTSTKGTPIQARNLIQRHFKPLLERIGISKSVRLYDLRHSTATLLLTLNVHPKVVQEMLGHSDIQLTLNTYSHVLPTLQESAAGKLSELLSKRS